MRVSSFKSEIDISFDASLLNTICSSLSPLSLSNSLVAAIVVPGGILNHCAFSPVDWELRRRGLSAAAFISPAAAFQSSSPLSLLDFICGGAG